MLSERTLASNDKRQRSILYFLGIFVQKVQIFERFRDDVCKMLQIHNN